MRDLPDGYGVWYLGDGCELTTPEGTRFLYSPEATFSQIMADAWEHMALSYECMWEPMCPVCEDRRRKAGLVA